jgi:hypothetical protein
MEDNGWRQSKSSVLSAFDPIKWAVLIRDPPKN